MVVLGLNPVSNAKAAIIMRKKGIDDDQNNDCVLVDVVVCVGLPHTILHEPVEVVVSRIETTKMTSTCP